jgi:hypothetical protein
MEGRTMSVPNVRLSADQLKAPAGKFRIVQIRKRRNVHDDKKEYLLIVDLDDRRHAVRHWQGLRRERIGQAVIAYRVFDDQGRVVDALGVHITQQERRAPEGKFRIIAADAHSPVIWLVADLDDRERAIEYAKEAYEGPYTGFQVHDDTGAALIPC